MVHHDKRKGEEPLVAYVKPTGFKNTSYLEVTDNSVLNSLDTIVGKLTTPFYLRSFLCATMIKENAHAHLDL
jgi:hypothetical protein